MLGGERAKRASLVEEESTRDDSREMTKNIITTSTAKLTHSILLSRFTRFALASLKMPIDSLGAGRQAEGLFSRLVGARREHAETADESHRKGWGQPVHRIH